MLEYYVVRTRTKAIPVTTFLGPSRGRYLSSIDEVNMRLDCFCQGERSISRYSSLVTTSKNVRPFFQLNLHYFIHY